MKIKYLLGYGLAIAMLFSTGCSSKPIVGIPAATFDENEKIELVISAAVSLTDVTKEVAVLFEKDHPEVKLTFTYGSSGALQTQIEEGAPTDVFLSAAQKQMDVLESKDLLEEGTRKDLLINKVVLIKPKDQAIELKEFKDCAEDDVKKIALGEPKSVPVGQYSEEIFQFLDILEQIKGKANYASDVRQVLTWVESGEMDCGVVYATDAINSSKVAVVCEAPKGSHKPVVYPVAAIKGSKHLEDAKAFLNFLSTDTAKILFKKYGFTMA